MNFSWAAVSTGAQDIHCAPFQRAGGHCELPTSSSLAGLSANRRFDLLCLGGSMSDCYLITSSSIQMDSRTRLWHVFLFTAEIRQGRNLTETGGSSQSFCTMTSTPALLSNTQQRGAWQRQRLAWTCCCLSEANVENKVDQKASASKTTAF